MGAKDVTVIGPFRCDDKTGIDAGLTAALAGADDTVISWTSGNLVWFACIEQA